MSKLIKIRQLEINTPPILRRIIVCLRFCCVGCIAGYVTKATRSKTDKKTSKVGGLFVSNFLTSCLLLILVISAQSTILYAESNIKKKAISNAWELPSIILNDLNGQEHNLYHWHGKVILLNFWATWCGPCRIEIPDFINYQNQYADQGLQVIGIGLDQERKLRNYVRTVGINYPILQADPELQYPLLNQWGNPFGVLPFTVIIAKDGHLVFMQQGVFSQQSFDRIVKPLLES